MLFANLAHVYGDRDLGDGTPVTPAYKELPAAMQLQAHLQGLIAEAASVFVLGGLNEAMDGDYVGSVPFGAGPGLWAGLDIDPAQLNSPLQFRSLIAGGLYEALAGDELAESFSIFIVSGKTNVPAVVHVRRQDAGDYVRYSVNYHEGGTPDPNLSYGFAMPTNQANAFPIRPGATHYWLRRNAQWGIDEHLGAQVVFPDPTAMPYEASTGDVKAFSRFILFIPTKM